MFFWISTTDGLHHGAAIAGVAPAVHRGILVADPEL
jgi:hypothetical protein